MMLRLILLCLMMLEMLFLPDDAMLDTARDTTLPDMPLGVFLDAHIARVTANARARYY